MAVENLLAFPAAPARRQAAAGCAGLVGELSRRIGAPLVLAVPLTYGGTFWAQMLHAREGAHEPGAPGVLVHWLRDATMALPLVFSTP